MIRFKERYYKAFHEKGALTRFVTRKYLFPFFQRFGLHVTGDHFYEIVPNTRLVSRIYSETPRRLEGINWNFKASEENALRLVNKYGEEYATACEAYGFRDNNPYFSGLDPLILYGFIRDTKPRKVVEIGQGFSTMLALAALERNTQEVGAEVEFISVDPYSRFDTLRLPEKVRFSRVAQELQSVDLAPLLDSCDFLFVDSSHVYKFGSDVSWEFTQLYPKLKPGTTLHLHDIYSPYEYPLHWIVRERFFWNEQYFVECFLMFNSAFEVRLPVQMLVRQSSELAAAVKRLPLKPEFEYRGSSFYIRRL